MRPGRRRRRPRLHRARRPHRPQEGPAEVRARRLGPRKFLKEVEKELRHAVRAALAGLELRAAAGGRQARPCRRPPAEAAGADLPRRRAAGRPDDLRADARPGRDRRPLRQRHDSADRLAEPADLRHRRRRCRTSEARRFEALGLGCRGERASAAAWSPAPATPAASSPPPTPRGMRCSSPTISSARLELDQPINIHLTGCHHSCAQHYIGDIGLLATEGRASARTWSRAITSSSAAGTATDEQAMAASMLRDVPFDELPPLLERMLGYLADASRQPDGDVLRLRPAPFDRTI